MPQTEEATPSPSTSSAAQGSHEVVLHVYDVLVPESHGYSKAIHTLNNVLVAASFGGVLHGGIEVFGGEYSFGFCPEGTGVYRCKPRKNPMYRYRDSYSLGTTRHSKHDVAAILRGLSRSWQGTTYDILQRNCCHFCEEFVDALGCKPVPGWLNRMAGNVHAAITTYKAAANSMKSLSEQVTQSFKWLGTGSSSSSLQSASSTPPHRHHRSRLHHEPNHRTLRTDGQTDGWTGNNRGLPESGSPAGPSGGPPLQTAAERQLAGTLGFGSSRSLGVWAPQPALSQDLAGGSPVLKRSAIFDENDIEGDEGRSMLRTSTSAPALHDMERQDNA